jgi:hypothetical protein
MFGLVMRQRYAGYSYTGGSLIICRPNISMVYYGEEIIGDAFRAHY